MAGLLIDTRPIAGRLSNLAVLFLKCNVVRTILSHTRAIHSRSSSSGSLGFSKCPIEPDTIEEWLAALALANPTKEKIRRVMNVIYRRGQKSRILPMPGDGNPVAFVTQSSKSNYTAVIVSPEQAFRIMTELEDPHRTLVFLIAVTGLRISEALGLKWEDLDYAHQMIHLRRAWVGNDLINHLKTDGSAAPVPLGELLADELRGWQKDTIYAKPEDWIFPSFKLKGKTPMSYYEVCGVGGPINRSDMLIKSIY